MTITADKWVVLGHQGFGYTLENLVWTPVENMGGDYKASHPTGYLITGTLTQQENYAPSDIDGEEVGIGGTGAMLAFISTDGKSIRGGTLGGDSYEAGHLSFAKQP